MTMPPAAVPALYRDPFHYELLASMTAPADLPFYEREIATWPPGDDDVRAEPCLLELGSGTGRLTRPLARTKARVTGLELSPPLLQWARSRAQLEGLTLELVLGDMRDFDLRRTFDLILLPYNTFNHLLTLTDIRGCLDAVQRHLTRRSRFIIDTFNPDPTKLQTGAPAAPQKILEYIDPQSKQRTLLLEQNRYDAATQINHITWRYEVEGERLARVDELTMRLFFPQELDALLTLNGLEIERKLGSYDGTPFTASSSHQIVVCRPGPSSAS